MTHQVKCWPPFFADIVVGRKRFDVRRADRPYALGDYLQLHEWEPTEHRLTGKVVTRRITYLQSGGMHGVDPEYCVLGLSDA